MPAEKPSDTELYRLQVREHEDFAMFLIDTEGQIKTWNHGVEKTLGYKEQEWIGRAASTIFTPEDVAAGVYENELRTARDRGRSTDIRWHVRKNGTRIYMVGVMHALLDGDGKLIGYSKVCMDDTARKRLEESLTQSNLDLQQFAYLASHDMQEPLRTINSFAGLLQKQYAEKLDDDGAYFLRLIREAADRMHVLIRDLLDFSRMALEEGRAVSVHLDEDCEAALTMLQSSIEATGAVITHDALPDVNADRGQMVRVFQNLIGNAIKFRKPDVAPVIHVSVEEKDKQWLIKVTDNGIGFAQEHADIIFGPFKRLHGQSDYPGSGIGLAACKRIVERYGGAIGAESQVGEGTTIWFTMPVKEGPDTPATSE